MSPYQESLVASRHLIILSIGKKRLRNGATLNKSRPANALRCAGALCDTVKYILRTIPYTLFILFCAIPYSYADSIANSDVNSDKACVFGCYASWEIYISQEIEFNRFGYNPKGGDIIAWKSKTIDRSQNAMFNGIWYYSEIMPTLDVTILMNGVEQKLKTPSCYKAVCTIDLVNSVNISIGDTFRVEVISVVDDGFINSMQPSVVQ